MDTILKMCKKLGKTFLIVRESNKKDKGYHYHAIVNVSTKPATSFFKKGIHIRLHKLGARYPIGHNNGAGRLPPPITFTKKELHEVQEYPHIKEMVVDAMTDAMFSIIHKKLNMCPHVNRVLSYLSKEIQTLPNPVQYQDYIYMKAGKMSNLDSLKAMGE